MALYNEIELLTIDGYVHYREFLNRRRFPIIFKAMLDAVSDVADMHEALSDKRKPHIRVKEVRADLIEYLEEGDDDETVFKIHHLLRRVSDRRLQLLRKWVIDLMTFKLYVDSVKLLDN
jgi:hypothetical protein